MFVELIATVFAGIACAGVVLLINTATGKRFPKWIMPVCAGLGMLFMTISNEYTWFSRTAELLPDGVTVATTVEEQSWLKPWTMLKPYTKRFVAVDIANARTNSKLPDQTLADLYFFGRWSPVNQAPVLFDCRGNRSSLLIDGADFNTDGSIVNVEWENMPEDDAILSLICNS